MIRKKMKKEGKEEEVSKKEEQLVGKERLNGSRHGVLVKGYICERYAMCVKNQLTCAVTCSHLTSQASRTESKEVAKEKRPCMF